MEAFSFAGWFDTLLDKTEFRSIIFVKINNFWVSIFKALKVLSKRKLFFSKLLYIPFKSGVIESSNINKVIFYEKIVNAPKSTKSTKRTQGTKGTKSTKSIKAQ